MRYPLLVALLTGALTRIAIFDLIVGLYLLFAILAPLAAAYIMTRKETE